MPLTIKLAIRKILKDRLFSWINIFGLSIGIISVLSIGLWVKHELSFDRFHSKANRIFRFTIEIINSDGYESHFARNWQPWVNQMPDFYPTIEMMARFSPMGHTSLRYESIKFYSNHTFQANPEILNVFDLILTAGEAETALKEPNSILLSESLVNKYFDRQQILGQMIDLAGIYDTEFNGYKIKGIFKDLQENSHFHPEILVSMEDPETFQGWAYTYFLLHKNSDPEKIIDNFKTFAEKSIPEDQQKTIKPYLQPLTDIHLYSNKDREIEKNGNIQIVFTFIMVALIIYTLALINYVNLNLALISKRHKIYIVSKILGADNIHILKKLLAESILFNALAIIIAVGLLSVIQYINLNLLPAPIHYHNLFFALILSIGLITFTSLISTFSQYWVITNPLNNLFSLSRNRNLLTVSKNAGIKKMLVVVQFSISIILFIGAIYINQQKDFMYDHRLGADEGPILVLDGLNWVQKDKYFEFKQRLLSDPSILSVTGIMEEPSGQVMDVMTFEMGGIAEDKKSLSMYVLPVDDNFVDFFGLELVSGEDFQSYNPNLLKEDYIMNIAAVKFLGFDHPEDVIGRNFKLNFSIDSIFYGGVIRGVVEDFNFSPMNQKIKPLVLFQKPIWYWVVLVKIDENMVQHAIQHIRSEWDQVYPSYIFDYEFNNDLYQKVYTHEFSLAKLSRIFSVISILIAALGLFALSSTLIELRTKEIGIRKVTGAYWLDIVLLLNKNIISWILISLIVAFPIAWYLLLKWNENYPYNPSPSWLIFCIAGIVVLLVAWLSIIYQSIKAAQKNPVEALRYE